MKNKIKDLNDHLFLQMERLNDEELSGEKLKQEIDRGKAMAQIATQIVNSAKIMVDTMKLAAHGSVKDTHVKNFLGAAEEL